VTGLAVGLAVAAGLAGAVQAAVMGELGGRAGIFPALAFSGVVSVVIGLALLVIAKQTVRGRGAVSLQGLSQRPTMSSGLTGTRVRSRPVAARSAATTAAVETTVGASPTPLTP
jgi:hypothetical protein